MAGIEKEAKKFVEKAGGFSKKGSSGKSSSKTSGSKKQGECSGADKANRVARVLEVTTANNR